MIRLSILAGLVATVAIGSAVVTYRLSRPSRGAMQAVGQLSTRPDIVALVLEANKRPNYDLAARDTEWLNEVKAGNKGPLMSEVLGNALSRRLAQDVANSNFRIDQIMVMDARGGLVAADRATHDYNQADEPKWQRTVGNKAIEPFYEGWDKMPTGRIDQIAQSVVDTGGNIIGAVLLRWCRDDKGCPTKE